MAPPVIGEVLFAADDNSGFPGQTLLHDTRNQDEEEKTREVIRETNKLTYRSHGSCEWNGRVHFTLLIAFGHYWATDLWIGSGFFHDHKIAAVQVPRNFSNTPSIADRDDSRGHRPE